MRVARTAVWFFAACLSPSRWYYMLYRMTLPIQPFIYQAF